MLDATSEKDYYERLDRMAEQTHPEILADNIEYLRGEGEKYDRSIEAISDFRQFQFGQSVSKVANFAVVLVVGEAAALTAEVFTKLPIEAPTRIMGNFGAIAVGGLALNEFRKSIGLRREQRRVERNRDHVSFLTVKAETRAQTMQ
ncbi:MAG TPA: hypothetical protein VLF39_03935 [Candidatus Saccharimonadales bacterium]|nr:hypothetical protein [Candidatus Saccharimonadales bacterium]